MPMRALWLVAVLAAGCAHARSLGLRSRDVTLRDGAATLVVDFDAGNEAWADYLLQRAAEFLVLAEEWLDVPFHDAAREFLGNDDAGPRRIVIHGAERVTRNGKWVGAYNNLGGTFDGERAIFIEYALSRRGDPAVVLHELSHFWFHDAARVTKTGGVSTGAPWFNEGAASILPLMAMQLTPAEADAIRAHWGLKKLPQGPDPPVERDFRADGPDMLKLYYAKTFKTQYLLFDELGPDQYHKLLVAAAHKLPGSDDDVLKLLAATRRKTDWRAVLVGWVFPGIYAVPPADLVGRF
jgi:hypothetical protein